VTYGLYGHLVDKRDVDMADAARMEKKLLG
jgi:hypothetical protein